MAPKKLTALGPKQQKETTGFGQVGLVMANAAICELLKPAMANVEVQPGNG